MRLIDADALRAKMYHEAFETDTDMQRWDGGCWIRYKMFENAIDNAPTIIDPQRMRGKWIPHHDEAMQFDGISIGSMTCSICGWTTYNKIHLLVVCPYQFCPNCGADMRGEQNEGDRR
jgi:hypothetical protein